MNNAVPIAALGLPLPLTVLIIGTLLTGCAAIATWFRYFVSAFRVTADALPALQHY